MYNRTFRALSVSNADALIGVPHDAMTAAAWSRVYRGLDHGTVRRELQRRCQEFSPEAQAFADTFQDLQNRRHSADYNHSAIFTAQQAAAWLSEAQAAITNYLTGRPRRTGLHRRGDADHATLSATGASANLAGGSNEPLFRCPTPRAIMRAPWA